MWADEALFNQLVGAGEQAGRDREAKHLRGLKVDDELELCRLLNGQLCWLCPLQDFVRIRGGLPGKIR